MLRKKGAADTSPVGPAIIIGRHGAESVLFSLSWGRRAGNLGILLKGLWRERTLDFLFFSKGSQRISAVCHGTDT